MIQVEYKGIIIASNVSLADNFWDRLAGYMFRRHPHTPGILFSPAPSIHTYFMNFNLDVIFMDGDFTILKIYRDMKPWRHTRFIFNAKKTLELPAGVLPPEIKEGDALEVRHV
jgi:uncharacterized membrane protein (UPF0127 family)